MKLTFLIPCFTTILLLVSCQPSNVQPSASQLTFSHKPPTQQDIAQHHAPLFFQDVDVTDLFVCPNSSKTGTADWIAPVNYDGDWDATNNWEHLINKGRDLGSLKGTAYINYASTASHYYFLYAVYHPRDWADSLWCSLDSHENDLEGVLLCIEKQDSHPMGMLRYAATIYHSERKLYRAQDLLYRASHPKFFIQAKGHGIRKYEGLADEDDTHIVYQITEDEQKVHQPLAGKNQLPQTVYYHLVPTKTTLWARRDHPLLFTGNSFNGDTYRDNAAHAPWGWGSIGTDPAGFIKDKISLKSWDTTYLTKDF